MMTSILHALVGGVLIGLAASWLLLAKGRVAGISGIFGGLLRAPDDDTSWRLSFVGGLLMGGVALHQWMPTAFAVPSDRALWAIALAGGLVGYGTLLGSGCTSGHGVCGLSRLSPRSLVATLSFMGTGALVATAMGML